MGIFSALLLFKASGVVSEGGVLMHELDKFNWFELSNPDMPWWLPCPRTCTYNQDAKCWCDSQSDRISAALVQRSGMGCWVGVEIR